MGYYITTQPAQEPITVAEMKRHLRLDDTNAEPAPYEPPAPALASPAAAGSLSAGAYRYKVSFVTADGETTASPASNPVTVTAPGTNGRIQLSDVMTGGSAVIARRIYRTAANGSSYYLLTTLNDNTTEVFADNVADNALGAQEPATNTTGDGEIVRLIKVVRQKVEKDTGLALITQTIARRTRGFELDSHGDLVLRKRPLQSVAAITYRSLGVTTTLAGANYEVDKGGESGFPRVAIANGAAWPSADSGMNTVEVSAVYGFGDNPADVPEDLRQAMMVLAGHFYNNREAVNPAGQLTNTPLAYRALIAAWCGLGGY